MLAKNIVLITGASSGIGAAISRKLSSENYQVILSARSVNKLNDLNEELKNLGYKTFAIPCDVSIVEDVKKLYRECSKIGFVNCIINNAGFGKFSDVTDVTDLDWNQQLDTNLKGPFLITRQFVKNMIDKKEGKILFINSVAGKYGYPFSAAYVASKFGLKGLADSLRNELRKYNIKVISIHPGAIDTNFWDNVKADFPRDEMLSAEDIANSVFHAVNAPNSVVLEEVVIRRTAGDF
tara:strand:+ start:362 stop:1072 length:711 start_codon:yes stop_codon:yes gene_type:complete